MNTDGEDGKRTARVFLVDDHPIVLEGMAQIIEGEPGLGVCGTAVTPAAALANIPKARPDVLVADLGFHGGGGGLDLIKNVRIRFPELPVLVLSVRDERLFAERALRAGAMGYVMKDEAGDRIREAVLRVLRGEVYVSERMSRKMLHNMVDGGEGARSCPTEILSDRELQVFEMTGKGLGAGAIAKELHLSRKTVETYYAHIKVKMGFADAAELRRCAVEWVQSQPLM